MSLQVGFWIMLICSFIAATLSLIDRVLRWQQQRKRKPYSPPTLREITDDAEVARIRREFANDPPDAA